MCTAVILIGDHEIIGHFQKKAGNTKFFTKVLLGDHTKKNSERNREFLITKEITKSLNLHLFL